MATPSVLPAIEPPRRRYTAADLAAMPTHLPSGDVDFELHNGRFVVVDVPDAAHGAAQMCLCASLFTQGEEADHGQTLPRVGIVLSRDPDTVFGPDISFFATAKLPLRDSPEGYVETIPDFVIEVRSRSDTIAELNAKAAIYLAAGVRVVWIADPATKTIVAHRPNSQPHAYGESDTVTINDVVPGFRLEVADIFRD